MLVGLETTDIVRSQVAQPFGVTGRGLRGLQFTGIYSQVGGDLKGGALTGGIQFVRGDVRGIQVAGLSSYANGDVGYMPEARDYALGGYETACSVIDHDGEKVLREGALELVRELCG